jgi:hypothetical protein
MIVGQNVSSPRHLVQKICSCATVFHLLPTYKYPSSVVSYLAVVLLSILCTVDLYLQPPEFSFNISLIHVDDCSMKLMHPPAECINHFIFFPFDMLYIKAIFA